MEFVTPIVTAVVQSLLVPIKKHLGFLVSSTNYVREMGNKMEQLNATVDDVKTRMETNNANSRMIPHHVPGWLAKVETIKTAAEKIERGGNGCFNMKMRYRVGKQSYDILKKITDLIKEESEITWTNELIPLAKVTSSKEPSSSANVYDGIRHSFESRDQIFKEALKFIEPGNIKTQKIALCGMGGVGKTTMMEQLKKAAEDSKMFDWVVKVVIGQNTDLIALQKFISEKIGETITETTKDARAERLEKRFVGMSEDGKKKILVILDDLWEVVDLKDIGLASPLPNGFKLLLTSRDEKVCTRMGVEKGSILRIEVLDEQEAKRFFWENSGLISNFDGDLHKIGEDIVKRCGGLPIALKIIASTLRDNIKDAWEDALLPLQNHDSQVLDNMVNEIFEISYNNLKEDDDRAIFHLSGLFPDDFDIPIEDLLRYGWGLKLFKNVNTLPTTRRRTNTCVNNLIRSNLLIQSDRAGCVKMHDLVRDFALSNFLKFKQASIVNYDNKLEWPTQDTKDSCERILLKCTGMSEFPTDFFYPNLKLLKLMDAENLSKFPNDFYRRMEKLEVVSYESMDIPLLQQMQYSTTLRALCLRSCHHIDDISFLGDLINMEILSFGNCGIRKLPSTIGKLIKLKLLDLTGCVDLCIDDGVFPNLVNLEELYMRVSEDSDTIRFTDTNCDELVMLSVNLLALEVEFCENKAQPKHVSFEKLDRFRVSIGCKLIELGDNYDENTFKNTLNLITDLNELLECKINELLKKTDVLYLQVSGMTHLEDFSMDLQDSFCNLTHLTVCYCEDLTYLFTIPVAKSLLKLEHLSVSNCSVLESLVHSKSGNSGVEVVIFPELKYLDLKNLPELVCVCDNASVIELPQLEELRLYGLPNFTSIFPENKNKNSAMRPLLNKEVIIPKLEVLTIQKMEILEQIWGCDQINTSEEFNDIYRLRNIEVMDCDSLVNLFPSNPMRLLNHLETLYLGNCSSLEVLFNIDLNHCVGNIEQVTNNSLKSIKIWEMEKLKEVWRIKGANNSRPLIIGGFQSVEGISIWGCKSFRSICTPATINFRLGALIGIFIAICGINETVNNESVENKVNVISKEEISELDDSLSTFVFTSHAKDTFCQLRELILLKFYGVEVVFDIETTQQQPILLPYLEELILIDMEMMSHVWKCNWNEFFILQKQHHPQSSFQNLTTISMINCNRIKYLFSPVMAKLLSNLKKVSIEKCGSIEEVVSNRDDEEMTTSTFTQTNTTLFPNLDSLTLHILGNLERIGGKATTTAIYEGFKVSQVDAISWSLCQYSREISIRKCDALSSVIPSYAIGELKKLEVLKIDTCHGMMEVFETPRINNCGGGSNTNVNEGNGGTIATQTIPRIKNIATLKLPNLKELEITYCDALEYVFTFSALESLRHLKELKIESCNEMRCIVMEEHGEQTMASKNMVFPCLKSIKLLNLPNLEGFFMGMIKGCEYRLLEYVSIEGCPKMIVFTYGESTSPKLKYICTSFGKYSSLNFHETTNLHQTPFPSLDGTSSCSTTSHGTPWSFRNLIEIDVKGDDFLKKIVPSRELLKLLKLEKIRVSGCKLVEQVFEVELEKSNSGFKESQTVVEFSKLREVELRWLDSLKYIWKSNQWTVFEFPNLTRLSIIDCNRLKHAFTSSMVGSLLQLQELLIRECDNLEVIVKEEEWDAKLNEITLVPHLNFIKLEKLRSLKGFCLGNEAFSWPSLNTLEIKECPEMTFFTKGHLAVPEMAIIETSSGSFYAGEDVNSFFKTKKEEGFKF